MRENVVRHAFHNQVLKKAHNDTRTFVINELGLKNGESRADIAVLNGKMIGYEIKTENDTLNRLPSQVASYTQIFDCAYIIVAENHFKNCLQIIPDWWGVFLIKNKSADSYIFKKVRNPKLNKNQNAFCIAQLLWKEEALDLAQNVLGLKIKSKTTRHELYQIISNHVSSRELSPMVLKYLKIRQEWRKDHLPLL
ncbi:sce7726 family protein [Chitinophaga barathri]|uniref:Sce7726 family protein n=1 Tax=Chitinophaga barathri TaxID=1647451 RepID=A0A3N4MEF9_9BACT|nr:sce7726 family protein [Chitinophaga barathri]RPD42362.1 hypothetical protein EG028_04070 [Chitinophaga barathri]